MYGSATAGLLSATLQIICLAIGKNPKSTALIYFSAGTVVIFITIFCAYLSKYSAMFEFYLGDTAADKARATQTSAQIWNTAKKIWPNLLLLVAGIMFGGMGHPNVTTLVISEYYGHGNPWNGKIFK